VQLCDTKLQNFVFPAKFLATEALGKNQQNVFYWHLASKQGFAANRQRRVGHKIELSQKFFFCESSILCPLKLALFLKSSVSNILSVFQCCSVATLFLAEA
jgi:hypothetical protein